MILLLKYQDDTTIKELSEFFDIGESAVKMRLSRAKKQLIDAYNLIVE
jgi:RNA polymerase sigma-70 factor (ECF subfamily)